MRKTKILKIYNYLEVFLILPIIVQLIWLSKNYLLPISDSGGHFMTACQIYKAFQQSFAQGLFFVFHDEGKPILFSHFMAPFLLLSKIDVRLVVNISVCALYTTLVISYYSLFKALQVSRLFSVLMTLFIVTMPYFFNLFLTFMPETLWNIAFVLFLNFLIRSENLSIRKYAFLASISFAICFLARPIESSVVLPNIFLFYLVYLYSFSNEGFFSLPNILLSFVLGIFTFGVCFKSSWYQSSILGLSMICGYFFTSLMRIYFYSNFKKNLSSSKELKYKNFIKIDFFLMPVFIMLSIWMLYYGKPLFDWAYDNSFGNGARINDQVFYRKNILLILWEMVKIYGVYGISSLFIVACILSLNQKKWLYLLLVNICIFIPMLTLYSLSGTSDPRRLLLPMVFGILSLCFYLYSNTQAQPFFSKLSILFFTIFFMLQTIFCLNICFGAKYKNLPTFNYVSPMIHKSKDLMIIKKLTDLKVPPEKIAVFSLGMFTNKIIFQAESLKYFNLLLGTSYSFSTHWAYADYEPYDEVLMKLILKGFSYILIENVSHPFHDSTTTTRMRSHTYFIEDVLRMIKKYGDEHLPGLTLVSKINTSGRIVYLYKIDKIYEENLLKITVSSQLNDYGPQGLLSYKAPGWHSMPNPTYPQYINLEFKNKIDVSKIILSPQQGDASLLARFAKSVVIFSSQDGLVWEKIYINHDLCNHPKTDNGFLKLELNKFISFKFLKIKILENCGEPSILTIQGLSFK